MRSCLEGACKVYWEIKGEHALIVFVLLFCTIYSIHQRFVLSWRPGSRICKRSTLLNWNSTIIFLMIAVRHATFLLLFLCPASFHSLDSFNSWRNNNLELIFQDSHSLYFRFRSSSLIPHTLFPMFSYLWLMTFIVDYMLAGRLVESATLSKIKIARKTFGCFESCRRHTKELSTKFLLSAPIKASCEPVAFYFGGVIMSHFI